MTQPSYLLNRVAQSVLVILGVSIIVFLLLHLTGDPAALMVQPSASEQDLAIIRHEYGLDKPLPVQLIRFLVGDRFASSRRDQATITVQQQSAEVQTRVRVSRGAIFGDFGDSLRFTDQPALPIVLARLPLTLQLMAAAAMYSVLSSLALGMLAGSRPFSVTDRFVRSTAILTQSVPNFWMGLLLILIFAVVLHLLPAMGYGSWLNLILPALTLGSESLGRNTRLIRSSILEIRSQDYVRTARAKGLGRSRILVRHVLKNALLPVVTMWGLDIGTLFGGAVITESIFGWPGMGRLIIDSVMARDFPVVQAAVFFIAVAFVGLNLLVDVSYAWLDPRIELT